MPGVWQIFFTAQLREKITCSFTGQCRFHSCNTRSYCILLITAESKKRNETYIKHTAPYKRQKRRPTDETSSEYGNKTKTQLKPLMKSTES